MPGNSKKAAVLRTCFAKTSEILNQVHRMCDPSAADEFQSTSAARVANLADAVTAEVTEMTRLFELLFFLLFALLRS